MGFDLNPCDYAIWGLLEHKIWKYQRNNKHQRNTITNLRHSKRENTRGVGGASTGRYRQVD